MGRHLIDHDLLPGCHANTVEQAPRGLAAPQLAFLHVAADALDWCAASRATPWPWKRCGNGFLLECAFGARQNNKLGWARSGRWSV
jgi:hypothetical protein